MCTRFILLLNFGVTVLAQFSKERTKYIHRVYIHVNFGSDIFFFAELGPTVNTSPVPLCVMGSNPRLGNSVLADYT